MTNTNEKVTMRNLLEAVINGSVITDELRARAAQELESLNKKNAAAAAKRAEKKAVNSAAKAEIFAAVETFLRDKPNGATLKEIAEAVGVKPQSIQTGFDEAKFEKFEAKVIKKDSNGKNRTSKLVGYKLIG